MLAFSNISIKEKVKTYLCGKWTWRAVPEVTLFLAGVVVSHRTTLELLAADATTGGDGVKA